jgi:hypothetical protein
MIPPDTSRPVFRVRCIKPLDHPSVRRRILERRGAAVGGGAGNRRTDPVYLKIFGRHAHAVFARVSGPLASERRIVGLFVGKRRSAHKTAERSLALAADAVAFEPVSTPKFPANREKNREFCRIRPLNAILKANTRASSETCSEIPYATEQGL